MARPIKHQPKQKPEPPKYRCRDCAHSYDWHNRSFHDGHLIFCRCPNDEKSKNGQFCKFLSDPECAQFEPRPLNAPDYAEAN